MMLLGLWLSATVPREVSPATTGMTIHTFSGPSPRTNNTSEYWIHLLSSIVTNRITSFLNATITLLYNAVQMLDLDKYYARKDKDFYIYLPDHQMTKCGTLHKWGNFTESRVKKLDTRII